LDAHEPGVHRAYRDKYDSIELYDCDWLPYICTLEVSKERPLRLIVRKRYKGDRADEPEECTEYGEEQAYDVRYPPLPFRRPFLGEYKRYGGPYV